MDEMPEYTPQPRKLPEKLEVLTYRRSHFLEDGHPTRCHCGGYVVGIEDWEEIVPGHAVARRKRKIIGGCSNAILSFEGV